MVDDDLLYRDEVYRLVGAGMEVYNELGSGYREPVYQEAYEIELELQAIPYVHFLPIEIFYKGRKLKKTYEPDIIGYDAVIVELKVLEKITDREVAQVLNYLKSSKFEIALILNFGSTDRLEWRRLVYSNRRKNRPNANDANPHE